MGTFASTTTTPSSSSIWIARTFWGAVSGFALFVLIAATFSIAPIFDQLPPLQSLILMGVPPNIAAAIILFIEVTFVFAYITTGIFLIVKRNNDPIAIFSSALLMSNGVRMMYIALFLSAGDFGIVRLIVRVHFLVNALGIIVFLLTFPTGRLINRYTLLIAIAYVLHAPSYLFGGHRFFVAIDSLIIALAIAVALYRYMRVSTPLQRQQTKWVLIGVVISFSGFYLSRFGIFDEVIFNYFVLQLSLLSVPFFLTLAVLRYRLYDVDLVINRGLVFGAVTVGLAIVFFGMFYLAQAIFVQLFGAEQSVIAIGLAGGLSALLFNPARRTIRHWVDRRLYGFRFDLNDLRSVSRIRYEGNYTGRLFGHYELGDLIGRGGMGEIYHALHRHTGKTVAVKVLNASTLLDSESNHRERFMREAEIMRSLEHSHIVRFVDSGVSEGIFYIVTEFIEGKDWREWLSERGKIPLEQVLSYLPQLVSALAYAHGRGFVHRDIKPSNIMLRMNTKGQQEAVLMDFGVARGSSLGTSLTGTSAVGTIDYMAPEQIMASHAVDQRADIYALGVVLYEMLTGEKPFKGQATQVLFAHLQQDPPNACDHLPTLPPTVGKAIIKAMQKNPDLRFETVSTFLQALTV